MILKHTIALATLLGAVPALAQNIGHRGHTAHLGASVMPFDMARSTHIFTPTVTAARNPSFPRTATRRSWP